MRWFNRTPRLQPQGNALTDALKSALLCVGIVLALGIGNAIDAERDAEDAVREQQARMVQAARAAYQQGLDDGAERELFRQQQRLAAMERRP
jgi:hypothetical protein